jgi:hypothetical protein
MTDTRVRIVDPAPDSHQPNLFALARARTRCLLTPLDRLSDEDCRTVIARYAGGVAGNFVVWLAAAMACCRSVEARYAATENAFIEIKDDHPGMLREFARLSGAAPGTEDLRYAEAAAAIVQADVSRMSGIFTIALLGTLENISLDYIPWLGLLSKRLGNGQMRYVDIHGDADIEHAEQFRWALARESALHDSPEAEASAGAQAAVDFIGRLIAPPRH